MSPTSPDPIQTQTDLQKHLQACLELRAYDPSVERVFTEVTQLFASPELQERLRQKGR